MSECCQKCRKNATQWVKDPELDITWTIRLFPTKAGSYVCTRCDSSIEDEWRANKRKIKQARQSSMF